jgi:hypothetical protein
MTDALEQSICAGAARALRRRAVVQRETAAPGVTVISHKGESVTVVTSEARAALKIATDLETIALELESGAR